MAKHAHTSRTGRPENLWLARRCTGSTRAHLPCRAFLRSLQRLHTCSAAVQRQVHRTTWPKLAIYTPLARLRKNLQTGSPRHAVTRVRMDTDFSGRPKQTTPPREPAKGRPDGGASHSVAFYPRRCCFNVVLRGHPMFENFGVLCAHRRPTIAESDSWDTTLTKGMISSSFSVLLPCNLGRNSPAGRPVA